MKCPVCADSELETLMTTQGVEIERCPRCEGVWLDRGEIFLFATEARSIDAKLERALADQKPTGRLSPVSGEPMTEIAYPGGPHINRCPKSGGLWFDAGELKALLGAEPGLHLDVERVRTSVPQAGEHPMMVLPNLLLRSMATLAGLTVCSAWCSSPPSSSPASSLASR